MLSRLCCARTGKVLPCTLLALLYGVAATAPLYAHDGAPIAPHDVWQAWNWHGITLVGLGLTAAMYLLGIRKAWHRAGAGRGVTRGQSLAFLAGIAALFLALISPLEALAETLFSFHMIQHLLLTLIAAPLLAASALPLALMWLLPQRRRLARWWHEQTKWQTLARAFTRPAVAWALHTLALWLWHLPALYQAALYHEWVHAFEHVSFLATAILLWGAILHPYHARMTNPFGTLLLAFTTALQSGILGVLLTFSSSAWYPAYAPSAAVWGTTPLADQQMAGVIMWVPAGIVYLAVALHVLFRWLHHMERRDEIAHNSAQSIADSGGSVQNA